MKKVVVKKEEDKEYNIEQLQEKIDKLKEVEEPNKKVRKKLRQLEHLHRKITQILLTKQSCGVENNKEVVKEEEDEESEEDVNDVKDVKAEKDVKADKVKEDMLKGVKRFVLFIGNLPKTISEESIKRHFQKVGNIKSVRIPPVKGDRKSGFAFLELQDRIAYEKTLSMHHTMFENKRINVLFTNPDGKNIDKEEVQKKNAKFNALRKAGKLAGSVPEHQKRSFRRKKKRLAEAKAAQLIN